MREKELIERVKGTLRGREFEAADDDGKLARMLNGDVQGKRSGDGDQTDVEEEICVTVNNSL